MRRGPAARGGEPLAAVPPTEARRSQALPEFGGQKPIVPPTNLGVRRSQPRQTSPRTSLRPGAKGPFGSAPKPGAPPGRCRVLCRAARQRLPEPPHPQRERQRAAEAPTPQGQQRASHGDHGSQGGRQTKDLPRPGTTLPAERLRPIEWSALRLGSFQSPPSSVAAPTADCPGPPPKGGTGLGTARRLEDLLTANPLGTAGFRQHHGV